MGVVYNDGRTLHTELDHEQNTTYTNHAETTKQRSVQLCTIRAGREWLDEPFYRGSKLGGSRGDKRKGRSCVRERVLMIPTIFAVLTAGFLEARSARIRAKTCDVVNRLTGRCVTVFTRSRTHVQNPPISCCSDFGCNRRSHQRVAFGRTQWFSCCAESVLCKRQGCVFNNALQHCGRTLVENTSDRRVKHCNIISNGYSGNAQTGSLLRRLTEMYTLHPVQGTAPSHGFVARANY